MNLYLKVLMDKPTITTLACAVCGGDLYDNSFGAWGPHHIVPRSQGGHDGPTITLCGSGTTGCHGLAEDKKLHFRWVETDKQHVKQWAHGCGHWEYLITPNETKYEKALALPGWSRCPVPAS